MNMQYKKHKTLSSDDKLMIGDEWKDRVDKTWLRISDYWIEIGFTVGELKKRCPQVKDCRRPIKRKKIG